MLVGQMRSKLAKGRALSKDLLSEQRRRYFKSMTPGYLTPRKCKSNMFPRPMSRLVTRPVVHQSES